MTIEGPCPTCGASVRVVGSDEGTMHYEPMPSDDEVQGIFDLSSQQHLEWQAWQAVVAELRARGVGAIDAGGVDEHLHDVIVWWAEELATLRLMDPDPDHAGNALAQRRLKAGWQEEE